MILYCKCGWHGDSQEATVWVVTDQETGGNFQVECPKCQSQSLSKKESEK